MRKLGVLIVMGLGALAVLVFIAWLVWRGMLGVPPNAARVWALVATVLLPVSTWAGWYFGHTEARGRLAGIDQAVDKVMGAATKAAGLHVSTARAIRRSAPPVVVLPDVEIVSRQLPSGGNIIEL